MGRAYPLFKGRVRPAVRTMQKETVCAMETEAERDQRVEVGKECYLCGDPSHRTGECDQRRRPDWAYFACSICGGVHEEPVEGFRMRECPSAWASYKLPTVHEKLVRSGEKCQYAFGGKDGTCNGVGRTR